MSACQSVSSPAYYGFQSVQPMETEAAPPTRKRCAPAPYEPPSKRARFRTAEMSTMAPVEHHRPLVLENYVRTTHNNPDISRCLMAYII